MLRFQVACSRCELVLFFVDQIADDELRALKQHLSAAHPQNALPDSAPAGDVLQHFDVDRA